MLGLKYQNKWIQTTRNLGTNCYHLVDDVNDALYASPAQAKAARAMYAQDTETPISEISIEDIAI